MCKYVAKCVDGSRNALCDVQKVYYFLFTVEVVNDVHFPQLSGMSINAWNLITKQERQCTCYNCLFTCKRHNAQNFISHIT